MADAAASYDAAQAHAAPVQAGYAAVQGAQSQAQPLAQPHAQPAAGLGPQVAIPQYAPAQAGTVPVAHPMVATVPGSAPPIPPTIVGNQAPQDPPPRRRARRATPASRGGRTRRAVAASVPAAAIHPQPGPGAAPFPATSLPTGTPAGTVGMAAATLANGGSAGMTQPSTDMWNQYSQAVNEFMSMQSKTIDKLLDRTYATNHSTQGKKTVQIDESEMTLGGDEELDSQAINEMPTGANPSNEDSADDSEAEMEEKRQSVRAKRARRPAPRKMASKTSRARTRQVDDEDDEDEELNDTPQRKMSRNDRAESSRYDTAAPTPGQKRYDDSGAIDLASYYK